MTKTKSLLDGIGNENVTEKYYDDWAKNYDQTLKKWNYKAPKKAVKILGKIKHKFDNIFSKSLVSRPPQEDKSLLSGSAFMFFAELSSFLLLLV